MRTLLKYFKSKVVLLSVLLIAALATVFTAQAVHNTGVFELDGNTINEGSDDWDDVYDRVGDGTPLPLPVGNFDANFVEDNLVPFGNKNYDVTVYSGGASDAKDVSEWACTRKSNLGAKFDFEHGYLSAYDVGGDTYIAMGANRLSVLGNSAIGIWLLQDDADCVAEVDSTVNPNWSGNHFNGDLLITADFENGGRLGTINVFNWVGDAATGNLAQADTFAPGDADCQATGPDHHSAIPSVCMTTNGARDGITDIITPWAGTLEAGQFAEGAINISQYFATEFDPPIAEPCFNTMVIQARASARPSAHTHDYIVVPIETCGKVILEKETDPAGASQEFSFEFGEDGTTLGGVGSIAHGEQIVIEDLFPGAYDAAEIVPTGWSLVDTECLDNYDETATPPTGVVDDTSGPLDIELSRAETVWCKFVNEQMGKIIVDKVTVPSGDSQQFTFTRSYGANFQLADATAPHDSGYLAAGTYSVSETVPTGWDLTSATCDDGSNPSAIGLDPGETVTCTFTNTKRGKIIVDKVTDPSGDLQLFTFTPSYGANFQLADATAPNDSGYLVPATYSVSETVPVGWDLTSATCDDGSNPSAIGLDPGETVTCTFNNRARAHILIKKVYTGAGIFVGVDSKTFNYTTSGLTTSAFDLTRTVEARPGAEPVGCTAPVCREFANVVPGDTYRVVEADPVAPVEFTRMVCREEDSSAVSYQINPDGDNAREVEIVPEPGETVICTYINDRPQRPGNILVRKILDGPISGISQAFNYQRTGGTGATPIAPFPLTGTVGATVCPITTTSNTADCRFFALVLEGTYDIAELAPPEFFEFVDLVCVEQNVNAAVNLPSSPQVATATPTANISIEDGETVICTYRNLHVPGDEGCTPGYWRNHFEDWPATGFSPTDDFDATFGVDLFSPNITLGEAIFLGGGGANKMGRHGTAALLSAAHPDVNSPLSVAAVIGYVQAGNVDPLVDANELGCDIP